MKKCYIIILLLIGFNCKEDVKEINDPKEITSLTKIFSKLISLIIKDMTSNCLANESICLIKLKNGLDRIHKIAHISYDALLLNNLDSIIMRNNQQTTKTYIQLSKSILSKYPEKIKIESSKKLCQSINYLNKGSIKYEPCSKEKKNKFRSLLFFGLIKKEDVCIFLMRLFGAKEKHCYN